MSDGLAQHTVAPIRRLKPVYRRLGLGFRVKHFDSLKFNMEEDRPSTKKCRTLLSFFSKSKKSQDSPIPTVPIPPISCPEVERPSSSNFNFEPSDSIERDLGKRKQICERPFNERDQIRRAYLNIGPYQPKLLEYQNKECGNTTSSLFHNGCKRRVEDLMKPTQHIDKVMHSVSNEEKQKNRLRLKTTIMSVKWLALQGYSFRGHDESPSSLNRGNFIELVDAFAKMNIEVGKVVLSNAPKNATYTSPDIQKENLSIMANRLRQGIRMEIGDAKFSILVDETRDESSREQMTNIPRFVNSNGILTERFFAIKSVSDTTSLNLKNQVSDVLVHFNLQVQNMRSQWYNGANNMCGSWNGLHALFLKDCPYAYYVHCFAHHLQLTLVSAAKDVS
ncbi:zinc finger MYM-type protein 1-like [Olea europaea var. sylvestris]|uniref:zinc finger MYM-type protein 1-like n=1 Tax=Olea europaea var. sylvestris TaxID=158386 RepID=UPI000C1CE52D|nr:zinc finger MYM-type protein 1-like [Olea europaea var. sylvestris]